MAPKKRSECGLAARPAVSRKRTHSPVSNIILDGDGDGDGDANARVSMSNVAGSRLVDPDYQLLLRRLGVGVGGKRVDVGVGGVPMNGDVDPHYKLFLEMLRVDRNGYSIELSLSDGLSVILAYEDDGGQPVNVGHMGGGTKRKLEDVSSGPSQRNVGGQPGSSQRKHVTTRADGGPKMAIRKLKDVSSGAERGCSQADGRPKAAKRKLKDVSTGAKRLEPLPAKHNNLPADFRKSEVGNDVKSEHVTAQADGGPKTAKRIMKDVSTGAKRRALEPLPAKQYNLPAVRPAEFRNSEVGNNVKFEVMDVPNSSPKEQQNKQSNKGKPDPVDIRNSSMEQQNKQCKHKKQHHEQSYSDSDVMILNVIPAKSCTPLVVLDADDGESNNVDDGEVNSKSNCPQHMKLLKLLEQPFDENELQTLMRDFQYRRPKEGSKHLRGGVMKTYKLEVDGLSYQDRHKDLADQIRSSNEKPKTLNLLRGFFHWLQNVTNTTIVPWKDPSCLEVLPAGCSVNAKVG